MEDAQIEIGEREGSPMHSIADAILALIKERERYIFTSNKEYWSLVEWDGRAFYSSFGDTCTNQETERFEITEEQVLERMRSHFSYPKQLTDQEIYDHITYRSYGS